MQTFGQTTNKINRFVLNVCVCVVCVCVCVGVFVCGLFLGIGTMNLLCVHFFMLENFSTIGRNLVTLGLSVCFALPHHGIYLASFLLLSISLFERERAFQKYEIDCEQ